MLINAACRRSSIDHSFLSASFFCLLFFFFSIYVSYTAHTPGYTQNMHKGLEVDEKSSEETCRNIHTHKHGHTPTHIHSHTHTENDKLQRVLVFKQIGMKDCSDHRLAMHFFWGGGHVSHLFWRVRSRQQRTKPESVFWQEDEPLASL